MITPETRRAFLKLFAPPTALLHASAGVEAIDPATQLVVVEGIDELDDPVAFLSAVHAYTQRAALFALIPNAAYVPSLAAFYAGGRIATGHPLVREEIEPLLLAAGWHVKMLYPFVDEALPATVPVEINAGAIIFQFVDPAVLERARTAAFFVSAGR